MVFQSIKGIIALDIDGTVTADTHLMDSSVIHTLNHLTEVGWQIIFITGRPYQWVSQTLSPLLFPYALAVQNGALLLEMPSKKILIRKYLTQAILLKIEEISQEQKTDYVIYSGLENEDWCYYRPAYFPPVILSYVLQRTAYLGEKWQPVENFSHLPVSKFSSIKFFAKEKQALILSQQIEAKLGLHAPPNRDPFNPDYFVIQATHAEATKGSILKTFSQLVGISRPIIAAGDDYNDQSMLQMADIKIVMANAPIELVRMADIIAPPAQQQGIVKGLQEAVNRLYPSI